LRLEAAIFSVNSARVIKGLPRFDKGARSKRHARAENCGLVTRLADWRGRLPKA
jgi:hypothetical protein